MRLSSKSEVTPSSSVTVLARFRVHVIGRPWALSKSFAFNFIPSENRHQRHPMRSIQTYSVHEIAPYISE